MYPIKQSTGITIPFFLQDSNGDPVTGQADVSFTKRISKNGGAFAAMTVTITEMENGWYSFPLSTAHSDTLGLLSITFTNAAARNVNLQFRVETRTLSDAVDADLIAAQSNSVTFPAFAVTGELTVSNGIAVSASTTNKDAVSFTGNGTGIGLDLTGGSNGVGLRCLAGGGNRNGFQVIGSGSGGAALFQGGASGSGITVTANSGDAMLLQGISNGLHLTATSGQSLLCDDYVVLNDGLDILAQTTGRQGVRIRGNGTGAGMEVQGGGTARGLWVRGGVTSGDALDLSPGGNSSAISSSASSSSPLIDFFNSGSGGVVSLFTSGTGRAVDIIADNNDAVRFSNLVHYNGGIDIGNGTLNGAGVVINGNGSGAGVSITGGSSGDGLELTGGGGTSNGVTINGTGAGYGIFVEGGSGAGMLIQGGAGTGADGLKINSGNLGGTALNVAAASSNGIAATFTGLGFGVGMRIAGGTGATALQLAGGGSGHGLEALGGLTGHGISATGGATSGDGIRAVGQGTGFDINADIQGNLSGSVGSVTTVDSVTNPVTVGTINANVIDAASIAAGAMNGKGDWNTVVPDPAGTAATPAEVLTQVNAALDATIAELGQGVPAATPSLRTGLMLMYMAIRNQIDVDSSFKEFHNDAGTVIWKKAVSDVAGTFSEAKGVTGP